MSLTSASSNTDVVAAYDDNADYDVANSAAKAIAFIQACRILIRRVPSMTTQDRGSTQFNVIGLQAQLEEAKAFLYTTGGAGVRHFDISNLRDEGYGHGGCR